MTNHRSHRPIAALVLLLVLGWCGTAWALPPKVAGLLGRISRDVGGAIEQVALLRDAATDPTAGAGPLNPGADAVGIAAGGRTSTLAILRRAGERLARRLDDLRRADGGAGPARAELLLLMRVELDSLLWSIEDLHEDIDPERADELLDRLHRNLVELEAATAAITAMDR
ncbi:MAG: hypothetical protein KDE35_17860 [Geminicoccaceae bacterium]|nr:hypothetical protein [Geminicoccaceae bacterium]